MVQILMGYYSVLGYSLYLEGLKGEEYGIGQPQTVTGEITFCQGPLTSCQPMRLGGSAWTPIHHLPGWK